MRNSKGRVLGVDYGAKRIGVAVSDPMRIIAQTLTTLEYTHLNDALTTLQKIILKYDIKEAVVGCPLTLSGQLNSTTRKARAFFEEVRKLGDLTVAFLDERFTSKIAESILRQMGQSPSKNKGKIDEIAAAVLLQNYLDRQTSELTV